MNERSDEATGRGLDSDDVRRGEVFADENDMSMSSGEEPEELDMIRARIKSTEDEIAETLDALQEKLSIDNLKKSAEEKFLDAANDKVNELSDKALRLIEETGNRVTDTIRRHPVPAVLLGLGLGWLMLRRDEREESCNMRLSEAACRCCAEEYGDSEGEQIERYGSEEGGPVTDSRSAKGSNILALGVAAAIAGAIAGLGIPKRKEENKVTEREDRRLLDEEPGAERRTTGRVEWIPTDESLMGYLTPSEIEAAEEEGWRAVRESLYGRR